MLLLLTPDPLENEWQYIYVLGHTLAFSSLFKLMFFFPKNDLKTHKTAPAAGENGKRDHERLRGPAASS